MPAKMSPGEKQRITSIETRLGPVGKGHHNDHRTQALLDWLRSKEHSKKQPDPKGKK
jgi:hypothetical protein